MTRHTTLAWSWSYLPRLLKMAKGDPLPDNPPFPAEIKNLYDTFDDPHDPSLLAAAFRHDMLSLVEAVRAQRPEAERDRIQVIILIDDLHRLIIADAVLQLLGRYGIHPAGKFMKAIFTYADSANEGQTTAVKAIEAFTNEVWVEPYSLSKFHGPLKDNQDEFTRAAMVYKQFLLHWQEKAKAKPLCLALSEDHEHSRALFEEIALDVQGIPSRLVGSPDITIRNSLKFSILRDADDEDAIEANRVLE
jgi:hypothetical protein